MSGEWEVAVLIPARNEEALVARCLESVIQAVESLPRTIHTQILLVSDCSTDRTAEIAARVIGNQGRVLLSWAGTVGTARAIAASHAIGSTGRALSMVWLANTDADCIVPATWLSDQIRLAESGIEAVAGIIDVDNFDGHAPEVPERFRTSYAIYSDGTHPHIHGANLGVRADRYVDAGGWADLKTAEDHDLWGRLKQTGARLVSSTHLQVITSGRRVGRAPNGFAAALSAHNHLGFAA
jgi:glycosyltransferase involved in cell wall biosynthesis